MSTAPARNSDHSSTTAHTDARASGVISCSTARTDSTAASARLPPSSHHPHDRGPRKTTTPTQPPRTSIPKSGVSVINTTVATRTVAPQYSHGETRLGSPRRTRPKSIHSSRNEASTAAATSAAEIQRRSGGPTSISTTADITSGRTSTHDERTMTTRTKRSLRALRRSVTTPVRSRRSRATRVSPVFVDLRGSPLPRIPPEEACHDQAQYDDPAHEDGEGRQGSTPQSEHALLRGALGTTEDVIAGVGGLDELTGGKSGQQTHGRAGGLGQELQGQDAAAGE